MRVAAQTLEWLCLLALVTSTVARVLLSAFAPIVAVFGHLRMVIQKSHNNQPLRFYGFLDLNENLKLNNPQTYFAAADPILSLIRHVIMIIML